jgi:hypothetical protein
MPLLCSLALQKQAHLKPDNNNNDDDDGDGGRAMEHVCLHNISASPVHLAAAAVSLSLTLFFPR